MDAVMWLLAANVAVWLGLGAYVVFIARSQSALAARVRRLEILHND